MKKSLVLAMAMALGVTASAYAANPFSDVPAGHWAYDSISKLAAAGIIEGYGDDTFRGDRLMTRYEMAQIVAKALAKGANVDKLAAEFADELDALGVRVAALEKKSDNVKITGEVRYSYSHNKYLGEKTTASKLRTRLWFTGKVNDNWTYRARLQNVQSFNHNYKGEDDEVLLNRAYLTGRLGGTKVDAGRHALWIGDGNVYDGSFDGIAVKYGDKIRVGGFYGKAIDDNLGGNKKTYGVNLGADLGKKVKLDLEYSKFEQPDNGGDVKVFDANLYGRFSDKFGLGAVYMHTSGDVDYIADGASKNGVVVTADIAGASYDKAGSWGVQAKYYHAPAGTIYHTMPGGDANNFLTEGYKGWSLGASYTVAHNMMATVTYYDLKGRENKEKSKTLWSEFQLRF
ncbi:MAG: S-layer homology domain-containing protein [Acidaminococcaceae bacterium]|nr:S-layer homology domain-containing protein [Acidaminococcaceae bacterium]